MSDIGRTLAEDLNITYVPRWSIVPLRRPQTVAEHSWRVARIGAGISDFVRLHTGAYLRLHYVDRDLIISKAVFHDVEEAVTGDMPRPTKPPESKEYESINDWVVDLADKQEALAYLRMWGERGRRFMDVVHYMEAAVDEILEAGGKYITTNERVNLQNWLDRFTEGV